MIEILDSTLRDGGYIIDWNFGEKKISSIVDKLQKANIDLIELGFLSNSETFFGKTIFNDVEETKIYTKNYAENKFCLMIKSGDYNVEKLNDANPDFRKNLTLRYIFKKHQMEKALDDCEKIIKKGYRLFINPVFIDEYKKNEFLDLIDKINSLNPYAISIVDSIGSMCEDDVCSLFSKLDKAVDSKTSLCFHSHNNTEHALTNAFALIRLNLERKIIIDSTVSGMGRGCGNICSELLAWHLNNVQKRKYNLDFLYKIIDRDLDEFYQKTPWGNSPFYYICALYKCHPDYAKYLMEKKVKIDDFKKILQLIPDKNRSNFNHSLIEGILSKINTLQIKQ